MKVNFDAKSQLLEDIHDYGVNHTTRELFLHGEYDDNESEEPGVDWRMASNLIKNLRLLEHFGGDAILIHMNTIGGEWQYGMAIYDAIRACPCYVTILAYAHARSMSSIILQAADLRVMMPHADFMLHYGHVDMSGTITEFETAAEENKRASVTMLDIYVKKMQHGFLYTDRNESFIRKRIKDRMALKSDWYMTAPAAVEHGLADCVLGEEPYKTVKDLQSSSS